MPRLSKIGAAALAAFGWTSGSSVTATYLVVAGGGSGRYSSGDGGVGGGGAGGLLTGTASLNPTLSYTVTVGAGGASVVGSGSNGSNSVFSSFTAIGGGTGAGNAGTGTAGGSGGGGGENGGTGGAGTSGQGNAGGSAASGNAGAGGGGAGGAGGAGSAGVGGAGGVGVANSISGTSTYYAGGGGGSSYNAGSSGGVGGNGGGGNGTVYSSVTVATAGTANTGGGGGALGGSRGNTGNTAGGSGVVIISYPGAQQFGGGVVTSVGGNTIHTFTTSGTLVPATPLTAQYLIVAGGAGGGANIGGGGGAGGFLTSTVLIDTNSNYVVTVGAGGVAGVVGGSAFQGGTGGNSSFSIVATAASGGGGGGYATAAGAINGTAGGSGGGAGSLIDTAVNDATGGAGTSGQGNRGGNVTNSARGAGGGGGASAAGGDVTGDPSGAGGAGTASSISGTSVTYAGGGGAGGYPSSGAAGGAGGGGAGGSPTNGVGTAGTANTGGGGGGGGGGSAPGGNGAAGGSGVVIIAYPGATQQMAGGTVTISGGNVIHTFTSSGYLTPIKYASRSLRFRASNNAYLNRTPTVAGNRKTWTWSGWVKRGTLTTAQYLFTARSGSPWGGIVFDATATDSIQVTFTAGVSGGTYTSAFYRDPSAWYHIVVAVDTTQATAADRIKVYVNGVQITSFSSTNYPSQNFDTQFNSTIAHYLGCSQSNTENFDGYMTEINFVDGAALTPSSFGAFNSFGVWQPITYGGSYGTNGFYLTFGNNTSTTTLGYDTSPQGNNWTTNNISLTAGATYDSMLDVPTLTSATVANYATLNPLDKNSDPTISNGNLQIATTGTGNPGAVKGTLGVSSGKWYWEITQTAGGARGNVGIILASTQMTQFPGDYSTAYIYNGIAGNKYNNGTATAYGASYTNGDVIGVALDMDAGTIVFYKNNSSQGTAFTGLSGIFTPVVSDTGGGSGAFAITLVANFGQRPFTYTPPSGFVALNTYNLSTPTIPNGAVYMAATLYTGTGAALSVANTVNGTFFQPDFVWGKSRSAVGSHTLTDSVRGVNSQLFANATAAQNTNTDNLTAFNSNGFSFGTSSNYNGSGTTFVAWNWKANGTGVSNTDGTITSTVSANTTAGFAVVTYTGTGAAATVGHGLGAVPSMIIVKGRSTAGDPWAVYHSSLANTQYLYLNTTAAVATGVNLWNSTTPTSFVFSIGASQDTNRSAGTLVAYVFAAVAGYSAMGSYTGNGSTDGPFVYTGFRPRFVLIKCSSNATSSTVWTIFDTNRSPYNASVNELYPNLNVVEGVDSSGIDILSNGFKPKRNSEYANLSGWTYIYYAVAENPFKYSNAR